MQTNRTIPYGYAVEKGVTLPHPDESSIVRRIFSDYLGGMSLLRIAKMRTEEKMEFIPGRSDWNKNRIKRILEDERYIGACTYPAIISEDVFNRARTVKDSNNNQKNKSEHPYRPPCPVYCILCGSAMTRRHDVRGKAQKEVWTCQNPECHVILSQNLDTMQKHLVAIMNQLIENPTLIQTELISNNEAPPEIRRLQIELDRELDAFDFDRERANKAIFNLAAARYNNIDNRIYHTQIIRAVFESNEPLRSTPLSSVLSAMIKQTVLYIQLGKSTIRLILKNHQIIERSEENASNGSAAT